MKKRVSVIVPILAAVIILVIYVVVNFIEISSTQRSLQFIYEHFNSAGDLIDYQGEIRMKDPATDIRLYVTDKKVTIKFGLIEMNWTHKQFVNPTNIENLKKINITAFKDKDTNRLRLFYKDVEIQRWVSAS